MSLRAGLRNAAAPALRTPCVAARRLAQAPLRRTFASGPTGGAHPPPQQGGSRNTGTSKALLGSVAALIAAGGAFLLFSEDGKKTLLGVGADANNKLKGSKSAAAGGIVYGGAGYTGLAAKKEDYQQVYNAIAEKLEKDTDYDDGSYGPVLVRLAWHTSGTYDKNTKSGGSNGATMRFAPEANHGANAGLNVARDFMEDIHKQFPWISYSDLWTLGGVAAVQEMGGPVIPWRPGRQDGEESKCTPDGRLPDGDKGPDHIRHIFYRMGFNDQEIVALSGAHALGRCHTDRSGFEGPWTFSPITFSNEYYKGLLDQQWSLRKWDGPIQYQDKGSKSLMMLTTDMALVEDKSFKKWTQKYAKSEEDFFKDFAKVFQKLIELGVPEERWVEGSKITDGKHIELKPTSEQQ